MACIHLYNKEWIIHYGVNAELSRAPFVFRKASTAPCVTAETAKLSRTSWAKRLRRWMPKAERT